MANIVMTEEGLERVRKGLRKLNEEESKMLPDKISEWLWEKFASRKVAVWVIFLYFFQDGLVDSMQFAIVSVMFLLGLAIEDAAKALGLRIKEGVENYAETVTKNKIY